MCLILNVLNTDMSCLFLNLVPLSCQINLEQEVLGRTSLIYAIETSSAILCFSDTMMRYKVNKHINVRVCHLPFDVAGRGPMQSMAHPAKGTFGISKCMGWVYNQLGKNCIHNWQLQMCWCTSLHMPTHQK